MKKIKQFLKNITIDDDDNYFGGQIFLILFIITFIGLILLILSINIGEYIIRTTAIIGLLYAVAKLILMFIFD